MNIHSRKKIGVVGTINRDIVKFPDGTARTGWGGMLYNLKALSRLSKNKYDICPICNVGDDCYRPITNILKNLPDIGTDYINRVPEKNNTCHLTYRDEKDKSEILRGGVPKLTFENLRPILDADIVLLNFISGRDIYLRSLEKFRRQYSGKIYIDFHSLTLGKKPDGTRYLRRPDNWDRVIAIGDYIQMNNQELGILATGDRNPDSADISKNLLILCDQLRGYKVDIDSRLFLITDGSNGVFLNQSAGNRRRTINIPPKRQKKNCDTTGCGDSFSAGFISGLLCGKGIKDAATDGNRAGYFCLLENGGNRQALQNKR